VSDIDTNDCKVPVCVDDAGRPGLLKCDNSEASQCTVADAAKVGQPCSSNCGTPVNGEGGPGSFCANPILGAATACTVLETNGAKVDITGPAGGLVGDLCIGPNGKLSMSGDEYIDGAVRLAAGATFSNSSHGTPSGGVLKNQDLSAEIAACKAVNDTDWMSQCTQTLTKLSGGETITAGAGPNPTVVCVGSVNVGSKGVTLKGPAGSKLVIVTSGDFKVNGGKIAVASADPMSFLQPKDVLYVVQGMGGQVAFTGGGGGTGCCKAEADGTLVAYNRKIALSPGRVNGQICSNMNISIVSGSAVQCPPGGPMCDASGVCQ
jgi:hypothetical protein